MISLLKQYKGNKLNWLGISVETAFTAFKNIAILKVNYLCIPENRISITLFFNTTMWTGKTQRSSNPVVTRSAHHCVLFVNPDALGDRRRRWKQQAETPAWTGAPPVSLTSAQQRCSAPWTSPTHRVPPPPTTPLHSNPSLAAIATKTSTTCSTLIQ